MSARIMVTGASGNVGSAAVTKLAQLGGADTVALTRSSAADKVAPLKALENVRILECDIGSKASLAGAFEGVTAVFLTCGNFRGQVDAEKNVIDSAVAAGVKYLVKLGTVRSYTSLDSQSEYARFHAQIEDHLAAVAGPMKWTVLCPNWFMTNHIGDIFGSLPKNVIAYPLDLEAKATIVDPRDVGDLAAAMLLSSDPSIYHGLKLDVAGPEAMSMKEIAAMYTEVLGRPVQPVQCPEEAWVAAAVGGGIPEWLAKAVTLNFSKWEAGDLAFPTSPEAATAASPKRTMSQWINEWGPRSPPPVAE